jgi:tetratricopeptide (TPR) repeat protein
MKLNLLPKLLLALLPLVLVLGADPADAQRRKQAEPERAAMFPQATRAEPGLKANQRFQKDLQRMYDASQKEQYALVLELADKVINNERAGKYERAISHQNAAFALMEQERDMEALEHLKRAIAEDSLNNDTHFQLMIQVAQIYAQEDEYENSYTWISRIIDETRSDRADFQMLKANMLFRMDRFQEAADVIQALMARSEEVQPSWAQLLMASYFEMEQPLEAARVAEAQLQRTPNDKQLLLNLASIYIEADSYDKAAGALDRARSAGLLTEDRDYRQLYRLYLNIEGREQDSIAVINEGLEKGILNPNLEVYNILGQAYYFSDRINEAIEAWSKADALAEDGEVALNLARIYYNEDRPAEARDAAKRAISKGVRRPGDAWIIVGNAEFFGLNNRNAGIAAYREATKYPETKQQAENWLRQTRNM